eukprot:5971831-Amphidinium_carterae.1
MTASFCQNTTTHCSFFLEELMRQSFSSGGPAAGPSRNKRIQQSSWGFVKQQPHLGKGFLPCFQKALHYQIKEGGGLLSVLSLYARADRRSSIKPKGGVVLQVYWEPWTGTGYSFMMRKVLRSRTMDLSTENHLGDKKARKMKEFPIKR